MGVFKLHLAIPPTYPADPPKAFFRTKIFHPNIEPETGAVCVETLKRDWETKLTLKDVLMTISCLLVEPNASSALNAEAGGMLEQGGGSGWDGFERRARMMTKLQAAVPRELKEAVRDAQVRGEEKVSQDGDEEKKDSGVEDGAKPPQRRRRLARMRETISMEDAISPASASSRPETRPPPPRPFVVQSSIDDVFGSLRLPQPSLRPHQPRTTNEQHPTDEDSEMQDPNQENDSLNSPVATTKPVFHAPPTRHGPAIPLGELSIVIPHEPDDFDTTFDDSMEVEYPPSPKKSPVKQRCASPDHYGEHPPSSRRQQQACPSSPRKQSPVKRQPPQLQQRGLFGQSEARNDVFAVPMAPPTRPDLSRAATSHKNARNIFFTPDNPAHAASQRDTRDTPSVAPTVTDESDFELSFELLRQSERRKKNLLSSPPKRKARGRFADWTPLEHEPDTSGDGLLRFGSHGGVMATAGVVKKSPIAASTSGRKSPALSIDRVQKSVSPKAIKVSKSKEEKEREKVERRLWKACGGNVDRWNRGDFGDALNVRRSRW